MAKTAKNYPWKPEECRIFRRWIETQDHPLFGLVLHPLPISRNPARFRRYEQIESVAWRKRFGRGRLPRRIAEDQFPFLNELASPFNGDGLDLDGFNWVALDGEKHGLRVQSLATPYRTSCSWRCHSANG